ncbi:MAG: CDP-glycerol glycerophosphotransferase family protein [Lachnospiraceae bacterium]|nr:CDP-glycerol glycerophosphotransferase family protein [Lachnospiraceae bacterium]
MKLPQKFKAVKKKIDSGFIQKKIYLKYWDKLQTDKRSALFESQQGKTFGSNMYALLSSAVKLGVFDRIYVTVTKSSEAFTKRMVNSIEGISSIKVELVEIHSLDYYKAISKVGYLFNDNTFVGNIIKKKDQIYINTWHGTPLKTLGKSTKGDALTIGNAQRNLLMADYAIFPNEFTFEVMARDYELENLSASKAIICGYPRNEMMRTAKEAFDAENGNQALNRKRIYAYLPTWRGSITKINNAEAKKIKGYLKQLDEKLEENEELWVKLHPILKATLTFDEYTHVKAFPDDEEPYKLLAKTDALITDYSSIMFDYAITGNKIVLFTYDEAKYLKDRGTYFSLDELPFSRVKNTEDLLNSLRTPKDYDDKAFLEKFCSLEKKGLSDNIIKTCIFGKPEGGLAFRDFPSNGKKNVLFFGGGMKTNGITIACKNMLDNINPENINLYFLHLTNFDKSAKENLLTLPSYVRFLGLPYVSSGTIKDKILIKLWKKRILPYALAKKSIERTAYRDSMRAYPMAKFDKAIQFSGYNYEMTELLLHMCKDTALYVHSDMYSEYKSGRGVDLKYLANAYNKASDIVHVTKELEKVTSRIVNEKIKDKQIAEDILKKCKVIPNLINIRRITEGAEKPIKWDTNSRSTMKMADLKALLESDEKVFINIGRFSAEKGQMRLLKAFARLLKEKDAYLIILGSFGPLYKELLEESKKEEYRGRVVIIKFLSNPYALLSRCDFLVSSSFYEGFGLTVVEADILKLPCFTTDIIATGNFVREHKGLVVENSENGILEGLRKCLSGEHNSLLDIDYDEYNTKVVKAFEELIKAR